MNLHVNIFNAIRRGFSTAIKDTNYVRKGVSCTNCVVSETIIKKTGRKDYNFRQWGTNRPLNEVTVSLHCQALKKTVETGDANMCHRYSETFIYKRIL